MTPAPDGLWVDVHRGIAGWGERVLPLSRRELAVLLALADANGRVLTRRELARRAGLRETSPRRCDSLLVQLRRVLGQEAIRTVRGRGWALVPPVSPVEATAFEPSA